MLKHLYQTCLAHSRISNCNYLDETLFVWHRRWHSLNSFRRPKLSLLRLLINLNLINVPFRFTSRHCILLFLFNFGLRLSCDCDCVIFVLLLLLIIYISNLIFLILWRSQVINLQFFHHVCLKLIYL